MRMADEGPPRSSSRGPGPPSTSADEDPAAGDPDGARCGRPADQPLGRGGAERFLEDVGRLRAVLTLRGDDAGPEALGWRAWRDAAVPLGDADVGGRAVESRVIPFRGGVYRGHVVRADAQVADAVADADAEWVPCGYGVWTRPADGRTVLGRWVSSSPGELRCCGHGLRPGLSFEGEWVDTSAGDASACPSFSGSGVGTFAFGAVFSGSWAASAPCGLGELVLFGPCGRPLYSRGWVRGVRCVRPCGSSPAAADAEDDPSQRLRAARRAFPDQPSRGLVLAARRLEIWRVAVLTRAMARLRRCVCHQSVRAARLARLDASRARSLALEAEARAVRQHLELQRRVLGEEDKSALVLRCRAASDERRKRSDRHSRRRREAAEQLELACVCAQHQREAVDELERELSATLELLAVARQAQTDCHTAARELQTLKRQIQDASAQMNEVRQRLRVGAGAVVTDAEARNASTSLGSPPPSRPTTAAGPVGAKRIRSGIRQVDVLTVGSEDNGAASVCDVRGCGCGIPRDVFLRVAATLNGDH